MKKSLVVVLTLALVASAFAGCSSKPAASSAAPAAPASSTAPAAPASSAAPAAPKEKVKLQYWFEGANPERTPVYEKMIADYNAQSEVATVEGIYVDLTSGLEKVNVSWAGKSMPDLVYMQDSWMSAMFVQGMCAQLDDQFNAWDEHTQFSDSSLARVRKMDMKGGLYAIPCATNITGIWYRKDVFKEKGVEAPTTWDNFFNAVEKLTDAKAGIYGHTLRGGSGNTNQLINEIIAYAGYDDYWSADGKAQILRSPEAIEYTEKFSAIYKNKQTPESALTASFNEMVADFNAGIAMTLIHNLGSYENQSKTFTPDQYGFYPFPPAKNGKLTEQVASCKGIGYISTTKYPEQSWDFVKWQASMKSISDLNQSSGEMPTRADSANQDWVKNAPHMSNLPAYASAAKQSVMVPTYLPDYNSINKNYAEPKFQEVLAGKLSATDFLNGWADQLEPAYAEYQKQLTK